MVRVLGIECEGARLLAFVGFNLVVSNIIFGGASVLYKVALATVKPIILSFYRQAFAWPLLLVLAFMFERTVPNLKQDWHWFILCGLLGVFLNQMFFTFGVHYAGAVLGSVVQLATPPLTSVLAILFKMEQFSVFKIAGILLAVLGALTMIIRFDSSFEFTSNRTIGIIILLIQCIFVSFFLILSKRNLLAKYPPVTVTAAIYLTGMPFMAVTAGIAEHNAENWRIDTTGIWVVVYAVVVHSVIGYLMMNFANKNTDASIVAAAGTINPLSATIFAAIFLDEKLGLQEAIGAMLIVAGLAVVTVQRYREQKSKENSATDDNQANKTEMVSYVGVQSDESESVADDEQTVSLEVADSEEK